MNGLALCAGVGGLELGLELALGRNYATVAYCERDAYAAATLVARMEDQTLDCAPVWDDIETFDGKGFDRTISIVAAGFPCQDISVAGSGKGIDDGARSGLWTHVARIIGEVGCEFVFLENSPAITGRGLGRVLGDLADLGFDAEWDVFSAAALGAPHRRRRFYLVARRISHPNRVGLRIVTERGQRVARTPNRRNAKPADVGEELADANRKGLEGWSMRGRRRTNERFVGPHSSSLADADRIDDNGAGGTSGRGNQPSDRSSEVGDPDSGGCEVERESEHRNVVSASGNLANGPDFYRQFPWPPGPEDEAGWRRYRELGGPLPAIRRGSNGLAFRNDRLRCIGNGVVPQVAARAFVALAERLVGR